MAFELREEKHTLSSANAILLSGLVCACSSCSRNSVPVGTNCEASSKQILAVVGSEHLTAAEFVAELTWRSRGFPDAYATTEQRAGLLDELIRQKAALVQARVARVDCDPKTVALIERLIATRYTEAEFARRFATEPQVEETEIVSFYESNPARFQIPAAVRAGFIWLKLNSNTDSTRRAAFRERAETLRAQAASFDANDFKALVQQHSEDQATRYTGGDTGWLQEGQPALCDPAVVATALKLQQAGQVAPLVAASNGFYVVRLLEKRTTSARPLADVRDAIRYELQQAKRQQREQEFFAEMKRGLKIEVNHALLNSISTPIQASNTAAPALPGG